MHCCSMILNRFRQLPTPLLIASVLSRFVFGVGLGALLASSTPGNWRRRGWCLLVFGLGLLVPAGVKMRRK